MKWNKLGLVWNTDGGLPWSRSHACLPTPYLLNEDVIRIYLYTRDENGCGHPMFIDVSSKDPRKVLFVSPEPLFNLGLPGTFDDNGIVPTCLLNLSDGTVLMYYSGFELAKKIPYRIFTGVAISYDLGRTFEKYSHAPLMDRSDGEFFFRCSSFVLEDEGIFKHWYIAGCDWEIIQGSYKPKYELRYQESLDALNWENKGTVSMSISNEDEHGFGRPWVIKRGSKDYQLFYSIRRRSLGAYRLGYAESSDGIHWERKDDEMGLDVSQGEFDSSAIMYSAVIAVNGKTYCFYNGNNFGEEGFGVAELVV